MYFNSNFNEMCSRDSNRQYAIIVLDDGLVPMRLQNIIEQMMA